MLVMATRLIHRPHRNVARLAVAALCALSILIATAVPLLACDIGVTPSSASGTVGDTVVVTVTFQQTHRVCVVPVEDTQILLSGMELVSESPWSQVSSMAYRKELTVTLLTPGEGRVEVVRVCPNGGDRTVATIAIVPAPALNAPDSGAPVDAEAPPVSPVTEVPSSPQQEGAAEVTTPAPAVSGAPSMTESLWRTLRLPYVIVLLSLMVAGTFLLARGYRRARPFAMLIAVGFLGFYVGGCPCPIGALQNVFLYSGDIATHMTPYVQLGAVVLVTLLFGRVFCGWACPMGATQFFLFQREHGKKNHWLEIPRQYHSILRWSKYGVLGVLIALVILTGQPIFQDIDPFRALFNLDFRWGVPLAFLVVVLAASLVIGFPFCKYVCPLGALLGLLQPLSLFKIRFSRSCTNCKVCSTVACDYGAIEPGDACPTINQRECVRCGECLSRCPCNAISFTVKRDAGA